MLAIEVPSLDDSSVREDKVKAAFSSENAVEDGCERRIVFHI